VARQCESLGTIIFGIQGGEPLIYPDLEDVIKSLNPHRNFISIKSNGTIAEAELFGKLRQIGVDSITVGFGPVPNDFEFEDYNLITRKLRDSFSLSLRTIEMIAEAGIKPMISVVIGKQNIRSEVFRRIIDLAKEYGSVLNCALAVPVGGWALNAEVILRKEDRDELNRIMRENPHVRTDFQSNWFIDGCGALKEKIYISPYGDVMPCPFIHISFGNVLEEPIDTIWRRGWKTQTFSEYAPVCIAAEDEQFLSYLEIAQKRGKQLPIRFDDHDIQEILKTSYTQRLSKKI
jgi:MoaA/NifB/PqqE/SkfB family radical SAM enzyme